ncbi:kinase-like domain-containing protein [Rhizophagus clarus]|uniref:Kinase-like domain-containing protein n=1 Tax=Rhizophagus clarus TaxID=94130 RepID=A0A8H3M6H5_9GLOM|nr:kinase-like domain-containing protein [Rhizophagus clarus]
MRDIIERKLFESYNDDFQRITLMIEISSGKRFLIHRLKSCLKENLDDRQTDENSTSNKPQAIHLSFDDFYNYGIETKINETNAFDLCKKSAEKGHIDSMYMLGKYYYYGIRTGKNEIKAFKLYEKAAKKGHIYSIYQLGKCYYYGIGTEKDEIKAFKSYKETAEKGHVEAMYNLGICYEHGVGTEEDKIEAAKLYGKYEDKFLFD